MSETKHSAPAGTPSGTTRENAVAIALSRIATAHTSTRYSPESMRCSRCFHIVGEHLLCRDHHPEGAAYFEIRVPKSKQRQPEPEIAVSWTDFTGPEWDFLDQSAPVTRLTSGGLFGELIP